MYSMWRDETATRRINQQLALRIPSAFLIVAPWLAHALWMVALTQVGAMTPMQAAP